MAKRRTDEQIIADLEARIAQVKARAARQQAAKDPTLRHVKAALRSIDRALATTEDNATRRALGEASGTLATCLGIRKPMTRAAPMARLRRPDQWRRFEEDRVLRYVRENPSRASAEIAAALGVDSASLCCVLERLEARGKIHANGRGRELRYVEGATKSD